MNGPAMYGKKSSRSTSQSSGDSMTWSQGVPRIQRHGNSWSTVESGSPRDSSASQEVECLRSMRRSSQPLPAAEVEVRREEAALWRASEMLDMTSRASLPQPTTLSSKKQQGWRRVVQYRPHKDVAKTFGKLSKKQQEPANKSTKSHDKIRPKGGSQGEQEKRPVRRPSHDPNNTSKQRHANATGNPTGRPRNNSSASRKGVSRRDTVARSADAIKARAHGRHVILPTAGGKYCVPSQTRTVSGKPGGRTLKASPVVARRAAVSQSVLAEKPLPDLPFWNSERCKTTISFREPGNRKFRRWPEMPKLDCIPLVDLLEEYEDDSHDSKEPADTSSASCYDSADTWSNPSDVWADSSGASWPSLKGTTTDLEECRVGTVDDSNVAPAAMTYFSKYRAGHMQDYSDCLDYDLFFGEGIRNKEEKTTSVLHL